MSLLTFYLGQTADHAGRYLQDLWSFSHEQLEEHHDFIQWLFPLEVPSPINPLAPTLDAAALRAFRATPELRTRLLRSFDLMLNFYGLERTAQPAVRSTPEFPLRAENWLSPGNHNHLRITRILHCLALCGLEAEARAFLEALLQIAREHPRSVTPASLDFWKHAVET